MGAVVTATTRIVHLVPGIDRDAATNACTVVAFGARPVRPTHATLFARHHQELREIVTAYGRLGVVSVAVAPGVGVAGHLWLEASSDLRSGIVGRHGCADLYLPGDTDLSLRHFAILVRASDGRPRIRVIDLRTPIGFEDENGIRLAALAADGPVFVGAARYQFFLFPTGGAVPWDDDAADPWATLPRREYPERYAGAAPMARPPMPVRPPGSVTVVSAAPGPVALSGLSLVGEDEAPAGHLVVGTGRFEERIAVGAVALARGVLLGRYERCDSAGLSAFADAMISRVHALVVREGEALYMVDVGSTNGMWLRDQEIRIRCMTPDDVMYLGSKTGVRWAPAATERAA